MEAREEKIKIAFIEESAKLGGAQLNVYQLVKHMDRARYEPVVICPSDGPLITMMRRLDIQVHLIQMTQLKSTSTRIGRIEFFNPLAVMFDLILIIPVVFLLVKYFRRQSIQVVVTNGMVAHFYGGLAAKLARLPCLWRLEDIIKPDRAFGLVKRLFRRVARFLPSFIVVPSIAVSTDMFPEEHFKGKVKIIYNAVDLDEFSPRQEAKARVRTEHGLAEGDVVIGILSRLTPWKGHREFISAARQVVQEVPGAKFLIVGGTIFENGTYERTLRHLVSELGIEEHVIFTGFRRDIPACIASMDICILPSILPDPCPRVLIEGMAMEKPFVATNLGGVPEILLDGETGILVPPKDVDRLAGAILFLIRHRDEATQMGKRARLRVEQRFSVERFVREHCLCFEALLTLPRRAS